MENNPTNKPTYLAYLVQDSDDESSKGNWTEIGAAWMHNDGKGLSINLHAIPLNGRVVLREHAEPSDIKA